MDFRNYITPDGGHVGCAPQNDNNLNEPLPKRVEMYHANFASACSHRGIPDSHETNYKSVEGSPTEQKVANTIKVSNLKLD